MGCQSSLQAWVAIAPHSPAKGAEIDHYWSKFLTDIPFALIRLYATKLGRRVRIRDV